jgi:hypothetical protein
VAGWWSVQADLEASNKAGQSFSHINAHHRKKTVQFSVQLVIYDGLSMVEPLLKISRTDFSQSSISLVSKSIFIAQNGQRVAINSLKHTILSKCLDRLDYFVYASWRGEDNAF